MQTVAPLFTALIALSMAISTLIRGARERLHQEYAYLAGVISIVFLCLFFLILTDDEAWRYGLLLSALFVAPASLQVFGQILRHYSPPFRRLVPVLYVAAFVQAGLIVVLGTGSLVVLAGNALVVFGGLTAQVLLLFRLAGRLDRIVERSRVNYLVYAGAIAVLAMGIEMAFLDWGYYRAVPRSDVFLFPPVGSLLTAAYVYFLGQVIQRHRLLDRHEIVARIVVFVVMAMVVGAVYGVLVRLIPTTRGPFAEAVDILIASVLVLILFEPVKLAMEKQVDWYFARERFQHILALREMKRRLPGLIELNPLLDTLFDGSLFTGRLDLASLYLYDERRDGYSLRRWEGDPEQGLISAFPQRPFIDGFLEGRAHYLLEQLEEETGRLEAPAEWLQNARATMQSLQTELCLPLRIGGSVLGVWNLRARPASPGFSEEELRLLEDLAEQVAVMVGNSQSFERMKERDRLATLGEMSAGLAHEIRNPLGAIKGAVQVLARASGQEASDQEFLDIIVEEVDRLDGVVRQFLDYARPVKMRVEDVDPDLLVRGVLAMVRAQGLPEGIELEYTPSDGIPPVPMDVEKLKQVLLNVVLNGIESMRSEGGRLKVSTRLAGSRGDSGLSPAPSASERSQGRVRVRRGQLIRPRAVELVIEDSGEGIRGEDAPKLFIPFFTTKAQGTGLGLPICERIMREHGGEIEVESSSDRGTRFTLRLPVGFDPVLLPQLPASS